MDPHDHGKLLPLADVTGEGNREVLAVFADRKLAKFGPEKRRLFRRVLRGRRAPFARLELSETPHGNWFLETSRARIGDARRADHFAVAAANNPAYGRVKRDLAAS